ncbi:MAG: DUF5371 family protein [Methanosarcinales archaeon]|nr:MAG: DUF5371 family protein [Methanosarcinales archaeon]
MVRIIYAQTVLTAEDLDRLKKKVGTDSTKEALSTAVQHYLECDSTEVGDLWQRRLERLTEGKR